MATINTDNVQNSAQKRQFCSFYLAGRLFGVDILDVKEIHPFVMITPVHHAPRMVTGYVNIRGQIYLILDLRIIMGFEEKVFDADSCLVLFKPGVGEPFGVLADKISDVVEVASDQIEESKDTASQGGLEKSKSLVDGICKLKTELLVVLKAKGILKFVESELGVEAE